MFIQFIMRCISHQEREERKKELERAWRPNAFIYQPNSPNQSPSKAPHIALKVKLEDMEVDESNVRQGTSPLLTSLLKSPSPAPNPGSSILNTMSMGTNQTRTSAPTITNLLTGSLSTTPQKNVTSGVPSIVVASSTPIVYPHQLQTQPLTGPPTSDTNINNVIQSPSQSAPTLSMLLENKNRESSQHRTPSQSRYEVQQNKIDATAQEIDISKSFIGDLMEGDANATDSPIKDEEQQLMDVINELIPGDELDDIEDILNPELLEGGAILDNVDDFIDEEEPMQDEADNKNFVSEISVAALEVDNIFPGSASKNENVTESAEELKPQKEEATEPTIPMKEELVEREIKEVSDNISSSTDSIPFHDILFSSSYLQEPIASTAQMEQEISLPPKEDDSSDSNDTPLSELLKHKTSMEAEELKDTRPSNEQPDAFESDSNDDKCLESIKREIQGLSGLKENNSSENSSEPPEERVLETTTAEEVDESKPDEADEECKDIPDEVKEEIVNDPNESIHLDDELVKSEPIAIESEEANEVPIEEVEAKNEEVVDEVNAESQCPVIDEVVEEIKDDKSEDEKPVSTVPTEAIDDDISKELPVESKEEPEPEPEMEPEDDQEEVDNDGEDDDDADSKDTEILHNMDESSLPLAERKLSSDEEIFEDAKESVDDANNEGDDVATETETHLPNIITDTDDDSPMEVIKEDKTGRIKRDYSRRKQESTPSIDKRSDDVASGEESSSIGTRMKLKDRDRSESPYCDDESNEPVTKSKRRCSSTPIIDSLPNSPASSDDREYRGWKKSILIVYSRMITHKNASLFAKPISEDHAPDYRDIVLQPMDLQTLKRNIENGTIRTTLDFQRYVMVMCYNAIFYNFNDELTCSMAKEMLRDALALIDDIMELWRKENEKSASSSSSSATKIVGRGRKSNRLLA